MNTDRKKWGASEWLAEGIRCFHLPDGIKAVEALNKSLEINPKHCESNGDTAYFYLGKIYEVEGRLEGAAELYSKALSLWPEDEESLIGRGSCSYARGDYHKAIADFEKVLRIPQARRNVSPPELYYGLALSWSKKGEHRKAAAFVQRAIDESPDYDEYVYHLKNIVKADESAIPDESVYLMQYKKLLAEMEMKLAAN